VQAEQNEESTCRFPLAGRCSAIPRKAGVHHLKQLFGKTNGMTLNIPPFLLLPPALYAEHDIIGYGASLWSSGVSCPGSVPSQLLVHPQSTCWWGGVRGRKGLDSV